VLFFCNQAVQTGNSWICHPAVPRSPRLQGTSPVSHWRQQQQLQVPQTDISSSHCACKSVRRAVYLVPSQCDCAARLAGTIFQAQCLSVFMMAQQLIRCFKLIVSHNNTTWLTQLNLDKPGRGTFPVLALALEAQCTLNHSHAPTRCSTMRCTVHITTSWSTRSHTANQIILVR
jgi:hypothetical protein